MTFPNSKTNLNIVLDEPHAGHISSSHSWQLLITQSCSPYFSSLNKSTFKKKKKSSSLPLGDPGLKRLDIEILQLINS